MNDTDKMKSGRRGSRWSSEDIERLTQMYNDGFTVKDIAAAIGRSAYSVRNHVVRLKLKRPEGCHVSSRSTWTDSDNDFLKCHIQKMTIREIANKLGKSYQCVWSKAFTSGMLGAYSRPLTKRREQKAEPCAPKGAAYVRPSRRSVEDIEHDLEDKNLDSRRLETLMRELSVARMHEMKNKELIYNGIL